MMQLLCSYDQKAKQQEMAFLLSLLLLFPLSVLSKSDPDNLSVHLHSNKSKVSSGRIWYLTIFQKGLHIQPSELEGASKHTAAGHIGDNTQNIARSATDPELSLKLELSLQLKSIQIQNG